MSFGWKIFLINLDNSIFHLCDAEKFEIKSVFNVSLFLLESIGSNLNIELQTEDEKLLFIKFIWHYYKFIYVNKNNEILFILNQ